MQKVCNICGASVSPIRLQHYIIDNDLDTDWSYFKYIICCGDRCVELFELNPMAYEHVIQTFFKR